MNIDLAIQIGVLVVAGLGAYYGFVVRITARMTAVETRCKERCTGTEALRDDIAKIKAETDIFWKVLEPHLANIIHSPTNRERDLLAAKLVAHTISKEEAVELCLLLEAALISTDWDGDKRLAGMLLLARAQSYVESDP